MKFDPCKRSEEQKSLDHLELDLLLKKYHYLAIKFFIDKDDYYTAERVINMMEYHEMLDNINKEGRLEPSGQIEGIMFIGINPSVRSSLKNVWEDPFGQFFGKLLEEAGIDKSKVWMSNLYKKPTPDNRPLNEDEIREGLEELTQEIKYVNPKIIVALGSAVKVVMLTFFNDKTWLGMYHPSYIRKKQDPELRSKYLLELKELKKYQHE